MSQSEKSAYFQALKSAGVNFSKHYREYSTAELKQAYDQLAAEGAAPPLQPAPAPTAEPATPAPGLPGGPGYADEEEAEAAAFFGYQPPVQNKPDPNEMAGQRLNTKDPDEVIRVDDQGRQWLQEEVLKPAYPKPRGRRVLRYMDSGVQKRSVKDGEYTEEFEVAGDPRNARPAEVKITLPSYQVGIYKDPRFPFKVVTYNGNNGFHLGDVQAFYGGAEMVPPEVKRMYVENVLCYDIRSVVRAINAEYRQQQLSRQPVIR
jgi:hypothetical protein